MIRYVNVVTECAWCSAPDGMREWLVSTLRDRWPDVPQELWRLRGVPDALYAPCPDCNPGGAVPPEYERLQGGDLYAFVWPAECDCVTDGHCPACRAAARGRYEEGEIPWQI